MQNQCQGYRVSTARQGTQHASTKRDEVLSLDKPKDMILYGGHGGNVVPVQGLEPRT